MATVIDQHLVQQLAQRMAVRVGLGTALKTVALRAARPHPAWIAAGAIWAIYDLATREPEVDFTRMEANLRDDTWDEEDMIVFRGIFRQLETPFIASDAGKEAIANGRKYILIPQQILPMIAAVDTIGMQRYGNQLVYDRAGRAQRRRNAMTGRPRAGMLRLPSGVTTVGSWEEYPFAVTYAPGKPGAHLGRVPIIENWTQGGLISAAKYSQQIVDGNQVSAHVV